MTDHADRLNTWHLELAIVADAIGHVLQGIEEPEGLSATAYVLRSRLVDLVDSCPFPGQGRIRPADDLDLDDIDDGLAADLDGVPADLLEGHADA
ncbi:MAG: hypothetical protein AB1593_06455 [Pseudomonadota bacterium]